MLSAAECRALAALWSQPRRFRKRIVMEQHRFGARRVSVLRKPAAGARARAAHEPVRAARADRERAGARSSARASAFRLRSRAFSRSATRRARQRPTPLLLHYQAGGYNRLHQDLYGAIAFPLQFTCLLSRPGVDFTGGEFLLVEHRPRMQSRGDAIALEHGEGIVFATRERPVTGARGISRAQHAAWRERGALGGAHHARDHLPRRELAFSTSLAFGSLRAGWRPLAGAYAFVIGIERDCGFGVGRFGSVTVSTPCL